MNDPYAGTIELEGKRMAAPSAPHVLVSGPTGVGKTRRVLAPAAAIWPGPAVVVSTKPDLAHLVGAARPGGDWLDLRPTASAVPDGMTVVRSDPTPAVANDPDAALTLAEQLLAVGALGAGTGQQMDAGFWDTQASSPLAALLMAAGTSGGIGWALEAIGTRTNPEEGTRAPSWETAAGIASEPHASALIALAGQDDRLRDSVAATMRKAVAPWVRRSVIGNQDDPIWTPDRLDSARTLYLLAPATGGAAGAAVAVIEALVQAWRARVDTGAEPAPVLLVIDELTNTAPLPNLPTYVTEARGLGVRMLAAVQATEQLALRWGVIGRDVLRDTFPAHLVMYGAPERELLDAAAWWAGRTERSKATRASDGDGRWSRDTGDVFHATELLPRSVDQGRLIRTGTPGTLVQLPDWSAWELLNVTRR
jgi:type IV secretory pathway TraG/TraD family ATPase VirD4